MTDLTGAVAAHRGRFMLALRREMGLPLFRPANHCLLFSFSNRFGSDTSMSLARLVEQERRDLIHATWGNAAARWPIGLTVVIRELLTIDVVTRVVPWCAGEDDPVILVRRRDHEFFTLDRRGSLARLQGRTAKIVRGRRLALRRIDGAARINGDMAPPDDWHRRTEHDWIEPEVPTETLVRFV